MSLAEVAPSVVIFRDTVIPYLRKTVAEMLEQAAQRLPDGFKFGVVDAWRPMARQQRIYDWFEAQAREVFPDRHEHQLRRTVNRFVAPLGRKAPPGHTTGAAVDVWLLDREKKGVDVCSPFDRFQSAPTFTYGLNPDSLKARMALYEAMTSAGFSNCRDEWWHYSYGDAGWAVRMDLKECFYDLAELPDVSYEAQEAVHARYMASRKNPYREDDA